MRIALSFFAVCLALAGCGSSSGTDAAVNPGNDGGNDAATVMVDAGSDGGMTPTVDGGHDAAAAVDANTPTVCAATYAGCTTATTMDMTGASITNVPIAATSSFTYDPPCIRIRAGTMVTITNTTTHPVVASACSPTNTPMPLTATPAASPATTSTYTFSNAGLYGYHCNVHGNQAGTTMSGLIIVE